MNICIRDRSRSQSITTSNVNTIESRPAEAQTIVHMETTSRYRSNSIKYSRSTIIIYLKSRVASCELRCIKCKAYAYACARSREQDTNKTDDAARWTKLFVLYSQSIGFKQDLFARALQLYITKEKETC
jgi:hypothetical protein